ncbi:IS1/IS1595 family N-terminal zinc-binding domain-containing protein [Hoylesella saccharolytica]|uniref:IS1/IS1595 family N-terminal zinc-binding domain-containing protein n=1 Tax=Hoylesella saccharolytica TaxID=633701 RepID=UPI003F88FBD9
MFCNSSHIKKNGHRRSVQMYLCKDCGRQFQGGLRINTKSRLVIPAYQVSIIPKISYYLLSLFLHLSSLI